MVLQAGPVVCASLRFSQIRFLAPSPAFPGGATRWDARCMWAAWMLLNSAEAILDLGSSIVSRTTGEE